MSTTAPAPGGGSGTGSRLVRRGSDLARALAAAVLLAAVLGLVAVAPAGSGGLSRDVAAWFDRTSVLLVTALDVLSALAVLAVVGVIAVDGALHRRRALVTALLAAVVSVLVLLPLVILVASGGADPFETTVGIAVGSEPDPTAAFVAFLTGADLRSRRRWFRPALAAVVLVVLAGLAIGSLNPLSAAVALLYGWLVGLAVRLALGVPAARPPESLVLSALRLAGIQATRLERTVDHAGLGRYETRLEDGTELDVVVLDRDRRDDRLFDRLWRTVRLRTAAAGHPPLTVRGAVERQALAAHLAVAGGVRTARVRTLTAAGSDAIVLVRDRVAGTRLSDLPAGTLPAEVLNDAWRQLRLLHAARVAHRDLTGDSLLVCSGNSVGLTGLYDAEVAASELLIRIDVAELLATLALAVGAGPAVTALREHYRPVDVVAVAALLQPVALASGTRRMLRGSSELLAELRKELLAGAPAVQAETRPARIERFRLRTVLGVAGATVAAQVLFTQLSRANPEAAIANAQLVWMVAAAGAAAVTFVGAAICLIAFTPVRLGLWRTTAVQLASSFVKLVTPPAVGQVAINLRYLQRTGVDAATAGASVGLAQAGNLISTVALLIVGASLTGGAVNGASLLPSGTVLVILTVAFAVVVGLTLLPHTRRLIRQRVLPQVRAALPRLLDVLSQPRRLAASLLGNVLLTGGFVIALDASLRAFGSGTGLLEVAVVYLAGSAVGSAAPTPGGVGAVEAALVAGLAAIGVPASAAVPAVLLFRTATFWLPVVPGWVAFTLLQRRAVI